MSDTEYRGDRRWGVWDSIRIGPAKNPYMRRISLLTTPWFSIKLHRIYRPDAQRDLHDHPWDFASLILWGGYIEDVPHACDQTCREVFQGRACPSRDAKPHWWFNFKRAEDRHAISWVSRKPTWTLVFCGPIRREWGFWVDGGARWVKWTEYEKNA